MRIELRVLMPNKDSDCAANMLNNQAIPFRAKPLRQSHSREPNARFNPHSHRVVMKMFTCTRDPAWPGLVAGLLGGFLYVALNVSSSAVTVAASSSENGAAQSVAVAYSPGIGEILKMVDAKVDPEVIKAYIKSSQIAYNPSAAEIIMLKEQGVPSEVSVSMLQRGTELRARGQGGSAAPAVAPHATAPAYDYSAESVYPTYAYSYPSYSYAYPAYYNYAYRPYYWPSFYFSSFPHHRHHFHGHHSFRHFNSVAIHHGSSFGGRSGAVHRGSAGHFGFRGSASFAGSSGSGQHFSFGGRAGSFSGRGGSLAFHGSGGGRSMGRSR